MNEKISTFDFLEIYSTKKVKVISEIRRTKEHQNKQLFNFYLFV